jgi:magnesium-transporting ATPase (P-type)
MSELSTESWMAILFFIILCVWCLSTFLFARISVKHIEREMAKEGIEPPIWDKGIGARIIAYAGIIVFPNLKRHASLVNIDATKRFARNKDKKLALFYVTSTVFFFTIMFTVVYLYGPDS